MVNATVDNTPVSIVLDASQSTTVPSNETWRVSIHLANSVQSSIEINGLGRFTASADFTSGDNHYRDVTLIGGQTISEVTGDPRSAVFITGFVVDN